MKNKDFAELAKRLFLDFPEVVIRGPMVVVPPIKSVLRGLHFEGSGFDEKSFYVWAFLLPLFVPTKHISFNLGKRLRGPYGGDRWSVEMPNLVAQLGAAVKRDALPFLSGIESAEDIAKAAAAFQQSGDPYAQQTVAYAWARSGNVARAVEELERLMHSLDGKIAWQREMAGRAELLKAKLLADPREAELQLEAWESQTSENLKLGKLR